MTTIEMMNSAGTFGTTEDCHDIRSNNDEEVSSTSTAVTEEFMSDPHAAFITEGMQPSAKGLKRATKAMLKFPLEISVNVIENSTLGSPLPYYGRDAAKDDHIAETVVGGVVWTATLSGADIQTRRGSRCTESVNICRSDGDGVIAGKYDKIYGYEHAN